MFLVLPTAQNWQGDQAFFLLINLGTLLDIAAWKKRTNTLAKVLDFESNCVLIYKCGEFIQSIHVANLNQIDIILTIFSLVIVQQIDQAGNQKHIINFVWHSTIFHCKTYFSGSTMMKVTYMYNTTRNSHCWLESKFLINVNISWSFNFILKLGLIPDNLANNFWINSHTV